MPRASRAVRNCSPIVAAITNSRQPLRLLPRGMLSLAGYQLSELQLVIGIGAISSLQDQLNCCIEYICVAKRCQTLVPDRGASLDSCSARWYVDDIRISRL